MNSKKFEEWYNNASKEELEEYHAKLQIAASLFMGNRPDDPILMENSPLIKAMNKPI